MTIIHLSSRHTAAADIDTRDGAAGFHWRSFATCREVDPELFFPEAPRHTVPRIEQEQEAKAVCAVCPVRRECLEWGLAQPTMHGIFGGTTEEDREQLHGVRTPQAPRPRRGDAPRSVQVADSREFLDLLAAGTPLEVIALRLRTTVATVNEAMRLLDEQAQGLGVAAAPVADVAVAS